MNGKSGNIITQKIIDKNWHILQHEENLKGILAGIQKKQKP